MKKSKESTSKENKPKDTTEMSAGEKLWKEFQEMPYDYSRVGQSFVMPFGSPIQEQQSMNEREKPEEWEGEYYDKTYDGLGLFKENNRLLDEELERQSKQPLTREQAIEQMRRVREREEKRKQDEIMRLRKLFEKKQRNDENVD